MLAVYRADTVERLIDEMQRKQDILVFKMQAELATKKKERQPRRR